MALSDCVLLHIGIFQVQATRQRGATGLQLGGPTLSETINRPWESVIHLQYGADAAQPWQGISPLGFARARRGWRRRWKNG